MKKKDHSEKKQAVLPKKVPRQFKDFIPSSMIQNLKPQSLILLPPEKTNPSNFFNFSTQFGNNHSQIPNSPFPEWTFKFPEEVNKEIFPNDNQDNSIQEKFNDPLHDEIAANLPLYLIQFTENEITWERPSQYVVNYYIDKEIKRLYPKKNYASMREDIKRTYEKLKKMQSMNTQNDNSEDEEEEENIDNYLRSDEETMKQTIYKDFYKHLETEYNFKVVNCDERIETDEEYLRRKEMEDKSKKSKKGPKNSKNALKIDENDKITYKVVNPSMLSLNEFSSNPLMHNSINSWLTSIYQMIIDMNILDVETGKSILYNIYPQVNGAPVYNKNGKYIIKLYHMGKPRMIEIDDRIPCSREHEYLLPMCTSIEEIWPALISKALLKLLTYKTRHPMYYTKEEFNDVAIIYAITGMHVTVVDANKHVVELFSDKFSIKSETEISANDDRIFYAVYKEKKPSLMKLKEDASYGDIVDKWDFLKPKMGTIVQTGGMSLMRSKIRSGTIKQDKKAFAGRVSFLFNNESAANVEDESNNSVIKNVGQRKQKRFPTIIQKKIVGIHQRRENLIASNNIISNFLYSVNDYFTNSKFNMKRLKFVDFSDLERVLMDKKVQFKQLALNEKRQYLLARRELKKKQLEEKNKRLTELKEDGQEYTLIKLANRSRDLPKIDFFDEYCESEINTAKKCILNNWTFPPVEYFEENFKRKEEASRQAALLLAKINAKKEKNDEEEEEKKEKEDKAQSQNPDQKKKKKYGAFAWNRELYTEFIEAKPDTYTTKLIPVTSSITGTWMTLPDLLDNFDKMLIIHNHPLIYHEKLFIDNSWNYYKTDILEPLPENNSFFLSKDLNFTGAKSSLLVVYEPFVEKFAYNANIVNPLYPYISFDLINKEENKIIKSNVIMNKFYSIFAYDQLDPKANYLLVIRSGNNQMGYIMQMMSESHSIHNMPINEYMKSHEGFSSAEFHVEHGIIEKEKYYLIARLAMTVKPVEENMEGYEGLKDNIRIRLTVKYPIKYIKRFVRIFMVKEGTFEQKEINENVLFTLTKDDFEPSSLSARTQYANYYFVIFLKSLYTIKEGAFDIEALWDDKMVKFENIEHIEPFEIHDKYHPNKQNLIFAYYLYPSDKITCSLHVSLYHIKNEIKLDSSKEKSKKSQTGGENCNLYIEKTELEKKAHLVLELYHLTKEPSLEFVSNSLKYSYSNQGDLVTQLDFYNDISIANINLNGDVLMKPQNEKKKLRKETDHSNSMSTSKENYPYLLICHFDDSEINLISDIVNNTQNDIGYTIRVFSSDNIGFIADTSKEDHEKRMKDDWENKDEGRALRASKSRKKFLIYEKVIRGGDSSISMEERKILDEERERRLANQIDHKEEDDANKGGKGTRRKNRMPTIKKPPLGKNLKDKDKDKDKSTSSEVDYGKNKAIFNYLLGNKSLSMKNIFESPLPKFEKSKSQYILNYVKYTHKDRTVMNKSNNSIRAILADEAYRENMRQTILKKYEESEKIYKNKNDRIENSKTELQDNLKTMGRSLSMVRLTKKGKSEDLIEARNSIKNELQKKEEIQKKMVEIIKDNTMKNFDFTYLGSVYKEGFQMLGDKNIMVRQFFKFCSNKKEEALKNELKKLSPKDKNYIVKLLEDISYNKWEISEDVISKLKALIK